MIYAIVIHVVYVSILGVMGVKFLSSGKIWWKRFNLSAENLIIPDYRMLPASFADARLLVAIISAKAPMMLRAIRDMAL